MTNRPVRTLRSAPAPHDNAARFRGDPARFAAMLTNGPAS
jgi:hypothetical protein